MQFDKFIQILKYNIYNILNYYPIYQPLRSGRIWQKVIF